MEELLNDNSIDAYIIMHTDPHLSEYIAKCDNYIEPLTGFTGSNAVALITKTEKLLWTDSRYFIQAQAELKNSFSLMKMGEDKKLSEYISTSRYKNIGIDKKLMAYNDFVELEKKLKGASVQLFNVSICIFNKIVEIPERIFKNIIDIEKIRLKTFLPDHEGDESVAGEKRADKIKKIRDEIKEDGAIVISELDAIAWLFNLRGSDIEYNPVFYSYAYIDSDNAILFSGSAIGIEGVETLDYYEFENFIKKKLTKKYFISSSCNAWLKDLLPEAEFTEFLVDLKSIKNPIETVGVKLSHFYDGLALCKLFEWVEKKLKSTAITFPLLTEKEISEKLREFKKENPGFVGESFDTICGYAENSAIIHHRASDKRVKGDNVILIDSGSQYYFGTTDVTRVINAGEPTDEHKRIYTMVLKGFLHAKNMKFKEGTTLKDIDRAARYYLWQEKMDFGHATSHGVGHFLNVHESPPSETPGTLKKSMLMSIEPGFYEKDKFGVRIEDLVLVNDIGDKFLNFESITVVPFQLDLINPKLLSKLEIEYVNQYSSLVRNKLEKYLRGKEGYGWLMKNTENLNFYQI